MRVAGSSGEGREDRLPPGKTRFISGLQPARAAGRRGEWCGMQTHSSAAVSPGCRRMLEGEGREARETSYPRKRCAHTYSQQQCSPRRQGCPGQAPRSTQEEGRVSSFSRQAGRPSSPFLGVRCLEDLLQWIQFHPQSVFELDWFSFSLDQLSGERLQDT